MKRGPKTALSNRVEQMSTRELLGTILITLSVLIGPTIDGEEVGIGWIVQFGVVHI